MKRFTILMTLALLCAMVATAIPAKPGWHTFTQSDGKTVTYQVVGDEWAHAALTRDGLMITRGDDGDFYYRSSLTGRTAMRAHDEEHRTAVETAFIEAQRSNFKFEYKRPEEEKLFSRNSPLRTGGSNAGASVPALGDRSIPVLLVQFKDVKFIHDKDEIANSMLRGDKGVEQYFRDQSNNKYRPTFDVYGIYTLSNDRGYYGDNGDEGKGGDIRLGDMVTEAINLAASSSDHVSFKNYDTNNDDFCDVVIIIYAGTGEAQTYPLFPGSIWPCHWDLHSAKAKGKGGNGAFRPNNGDPLVDVFAVFNELRGPTGVLQHVDGIGTFCHEFSHALGLPDFYPTNNTNYYGMGNWSLMDHGCYNDNMDTPIGYNAYEKKFMGWADYTVATAGTYYTLPIWNQAKWKQGNANTDKAICVSSEIKPFIDGDTETPQEYFIYENRSSKSKWDADIPDEGILVTHVSYVPERWSGVGDRPNNQQIQLMTILPADNNLTDDSEDKDLWPRGNNNALTDESAPSTKLYLDQNGNITGNAGKLGKPVTDMVINNDGSASFWYMKNQAELLSATPHFINFGKVKCGTKKTWTVRIAGSNLEGDVELSIEGENANKFSVDKTTIPVNQFSSEGYNVTVTYTALIVDVALLTHKATLHIRSGRQHVAVELMAQSSIFGDEDGDGLFNINDIPALIDYLLQGQDSPYSGQVSIDILSAYIDYLLNGETSVDLDGGLVAYYPLDGNAQDMSGNGNHGVATNVTATQGITGVQGTAYRFGGTDSPGYIRVPNSSSLRFSDGFTFSCFVKPMDWRGMNGSGAIVDHGSHCIFAKSSDQTGPAMMFSGEDDGLHVWCGSVNSQNQWANIGSSDFMSNGDFLNKWVHVVVTYSASKRKARLFVNGNLINERFLTTPVDYSMMNSSDLYLGRFKTSNWWNPMNGALDEVRIYNRALNVPEVQELASEFITDAQVGLSESVVVMAVGEEVRVNIKNGCGNYSVGCVPDVVDCRVEGETIVLTGMGEGTTNVTFNDIDSHIHILLPVTVVRSEVTYTVNGVSFTMIPVLGGTFTMGATDEQGSDAADNERPPHLVTLSSYSIGQTEVTQELWQAVMGNNPSMYTGDLKRPVERVSWEDCQQFITKLNSLTGVNFRLPTEAEWEYAARGGAMSQHYKYAGGNNLSEVAWWGYGYDDNGPSGNSGFTTHPVGTKNPNELNLYDMSGNVMEWCSDWLGLYTSAALVNPTGIDSGTSRVSRGGAWGNAATTCRVSYRIGNLPNNRNPALGFRLAL